jgi:hypothetical protein
MRSTGASNPRANPRRATIAMRIYWWLSRRTSQSPSDCGMPRSPRRHHGRIMPNSRRASRRSPADIVVRSRPPTTTLPSVGLVSRLIVRTSVVLPVPLRPTMPNTSPYGIDRLTLCSASIKPRGPAKRCKILRSSIMKKRRTIAGERFASRCWQSPPLLYFGLDARFYRTHGMPFNNRFRFFHNRTEFSAFAHTAYRLIRGRRLAAPFRCPLIDERLHALERRVHHHVAGHRLAGKLIRGLDAHFELTIEKCLAHAHRVARLRADARG